MKGFVQEGVRLTLAAPYARLGGEAAKIGAMVVVACHDVANGASGEWLTEGVMELNTLSTDVATVGQLAYWDDTNKRFTTTLAGNTKAGMFVAAKAGTTAVGVIKLFDCF